MSMRKPGDVTVTSWFDPVASRRLVKIGRADPVILVAAELMHAALMGEATAFGLDAHEGRRYVEADGERFVIRDDFGAEFIYRIDGYDTTMSVWRCEWPD